MTNWMWEYFVKYRQIPHNIITELNNSMKGGLYHPTLKKQRCELFIFFDAFFFLYFQHKMGRISLQKERYNKPIDKTTKGYQKWLT